MVKDDLRVLFFAALRFFVFGVVAVILTTLIYYIIKSECNDGLDAWRIGFGCSYVVTYQGQKYYCDYAESLAGYPEKIVLHRGEDYLLLPDKYAVEKMNPLPNSGPTTRGK